MPAPMVASTLRVLQATSERNALRLDEQQLADAIALHLQSAYFATYAMVCYLSDVSVLRSNKF